MAVTAADLEIRFRSDTKGAEQGIDRMGSKVKGLGGVMGTALGFLGGNLLYDAARGFGDLVGGALDFEAAMANVNSIAQLSQDQLAGVSAAVNAMATDTAQAPEVLAKGLYDIYSSGFKGAEALDVLEASANAATAGLTSTDVSARAITAAMNAYGQDTYTAQQISDVFFQTVSDGVLTFDELANNLGKTLAPAKSLGIGIEDLAAGYAQLTLNGINASAAETGLSGIMKAIMNPTDAMTKAITDYGYASSAALIDAKGLPGIVAAITAEAKNTGIPLQDMVGDIDAVTASMILGKDGAKDFNAEAAKMNTQLAVGGATAAALAKQQKSAAFAINQMKIAVKQTAVVLVGALAPAISLGARGLTKFVTGGLLPASEAVSGFFGHLKDAASSGISVESILDKIFGHEADTGAMAGLGPGGWVVEGPGKLRAFTKDLLLMADAAGDVVRGFQQGGFSGAIDALGPAADQIKSALGDLAGQTFDLAIDVAVNIASWAWGEIPDLWGWIKGELGMNDKLDAYSSPGQASPDVISGLTLTDVAVNIASWAWGEVADLWGWIQGELGVTSGSNGSTGPLGSHGGLGGGTPATGTDATAVTLTDVAVNIGSWAITALVDLGTAVVGKIAEWWPAIRDVGIELGGILVDIANWTINAADGLGTAVVGKIAEWWPAVRDAGMNLGGLIVNLDAPTIAGDLHSWIQTWLDDHPGVGVTLDDWALYLNDPTKVNTPNLDSAVNAELAKDTSTTGILAKWYLALSGEPTTQGNQAAVKSSIETWLEENTKDAFTLHNIVVNTPFVSDVVGLPLAVNNAVNALDPFILALAGLNVDFSFLTKLDFVGLDELGAKIGEAVWTAITDYVGSKSWSDIFGAIGGGGSNASEGFTNGASLSPNFDPNRQFNELINSSAYSGAGPVGSGGYGDILKAEPQHFTAILDLDTAPFDQLYPPVKTKLDDYGKTHSKATFDIDTGPAAIKYTDAFTWGGVWDAASFMATFDIDTGPAAIKYTDAFTWGGVWDAASFMAEFGIDNGPAAIAYTDAMTWGGIWDSQVFTASFSVDTSGLDAAASHALAVATYIAAIMPHSPAKMGPLSKPISFGYIADDLRGTMDDLRTHADRGMAAFASRMNQRVGFGGFGTGAAGLGGGGGRQLTVNPTVHINAPVYGVNDLKKTINDAFANDGVPAILNAIERQDRANGAQA